MRQHEFQCGLSEGIGFTTDFKKISRLATVVSYSIHRGHGESRAVRQHTHVAGKFNKAQPKCFALGFKFSQFFGCPFCTEFALPFDARIIEREFAVESHHVVVMGNRQRIDFYQLGIVIGIDLVEVQQGSAQQVDSVCGDGRGDQQLKGVTVDAVSNVDRKLQQVVRMSRSNVLNVHAAMTRKQQ